MSTLISLPSLYPVACHTDNIGPGSTFVAVKGLQDDGIAYIPQALARGATHIVVDKNVTLSTELLAELKEKRVKLTSVDNTRKALASLSEQALGYPARSLRIIGITGT